MTVAPGSPARRVALFRDTNANGTFDSGTDLQVGSSVTTPASGAYSFTGLAIGTYFVIETNASGFVSTNAIAGTGTGTTSTKVSNDQIKVVITTAGSTSTGNNFLDQQQNAAISGSVLNDANGDGTANDGGTGIAGASVALFRDTNANGTFDSGTDLQVGSSVTTPASGAYSFTGLAIGTYFVIETNASGFVSTNAIAGTGTGTTSTKVSNDQIKVVITTAGSTSTGNNFLDQQQTDLRITKDDGRDASGHRGTLDDVHDHGHEPRAVHGASGGRGQGHHPGRPTRSPSSEADCSASAARH